MPRDNIHDNTELDDQTTLFYHHFSQHPRLTNTFLNFVGATAAPCVALPFSYTLAAIPYDLRLARQSGNTTPAKELISTTLKTQGFVNGYVKPALYNGMPKSAASAVAAGLITPIQSLGNHFGIPQSATKVALPFLAAYMESFTFGGANRDIAERIPKPPANPITNMSLYAKHIGLLAFCRNAYGMAISLALKEGASTIHPETRQGVFAKNAALISATLVASTATNIPEVAMAAVTNHHSNQPTQKISLPNIIGNHISKNGIQCLTKGMGARAIFFAIMTLSRAAALAIGQKMTSSPDTSLDNAHIPQYEQNTGTIAKG